MLCYVMLFYLFLPISHIIQLFLEHINIYSVGLILSNSFWLDNVTLVNVIAPSKLSLELTSDPVWFMLCTFFLYLFSLSKCQTSLALIPKCVTGLFD